MTQKAIKITIEGPFKSGKTTVAKVLEKALMQNDVNVIYSSQDRYQTEDVLKSKLRAMVERDVVVEIVEKSIPYTPQTRVKKD